MPSRAIFYLFFLFCSFRKLLPVSALKEATFGFKRAQKKRLFFSLGSLAFSVFSINSFPFSQKLSQFKDVLFVVTVLFPDKGLFVFHFSENLIYHDFAISAVLRLPKSFRQEQEFLLKWHILFNQIR